MWGTLLPKSCDKWSVIPWDKTELAGVSGKAGGVYNLLAVRMGSSEDVDAGAYASANGRDVVKRGWCGPWGWPFNVVLF